jgi:hypothetical protein
MQLPPRNPGIAGPVQPASKLPAKIPVYATIRPPTLKPEFERPLPVDFGGAKPIVGPTIIPPVGPVSQGQQLPVGTQLQGQQLPVGTQLQGQQLPVGTQLQGQQLPVGTGFQGQQ